MSALLVSTLRFRLFRLSCTTVLALWLCSSCLAVSWFDDFEDGDAEDGNPVTWTYNEIGASPGVYEVVDGDYQLSAPGMTDDDNALASVGVDFTDTYVRTQAFVQPGPGVDEEGGNVGVLARYNPNTLSGYAAVIDDGSFYTLVRIDFGEATPLAGADDLTFNADTDVLVELQAIGDNLKLFLWKPDEPKPASPIADVTDSTYASGRAGLVYNEDDDNTIGVFRFAAAQDTPFVDALPGDFDADNDSDGRDFVIWQRDLGDASSLATWQESFGTGVATQGAASVVPEPACLALLLLGVCATTGSRGRRHG